MGRLAIPDEGGHLYRSWLVSYGRCSGLPAIGSSFDYRLLDTTVSWQSLPPDTTGRDMLALVDDAHSRPLPVISLFYAVNLYSCLPYVPAGAAIGAGRIFTASPLWLMYIGRLANLFVYLAFTYTALRLLPGFQVPIAALALMPMSLHQAASLSADSFTLGFSFLLIAWLLRLAFDSTPFSRRDYILLTLASIAAGLCKSSAGLLFLLLLIPTVRFRRPATRWVTVTGLIVLGYATAGTWQLVNHQNVEIHSTLKHAAGIDPEANAQAVLHHPLSFTVSVVHTSTSMAYEYLEEFVGKLGWLVIRLPGWIPWLYLGLLVVIAITSSAGSRLTPWRRFLLLAMFVVNAATLFAVVWTTEIPRDLLARDFLAGRGIIPGLQGRYLIPIAPLFLLAISGALPESFLSRLRNTHWAPVVTFGIALAVNGVALGMVWDQYDARSSTIANRIRMALHFEFRATPENAALRYNERVISGRNSDGTMFMVSGGVRHPVTKPVSITARGYRIPNDILLVPESELAAIPAGDPLPLPPRGTYEGQLVRRPGDTAEDGKVFVVRDGQKHWIIDGHWILVNGFKWPDDVKTIPASDLAQIPEGDAIR
jgi:uncharacterized membrane protein